MSDVAMSDAPDAPPVMPVLPEGIGLSLDEVRALIEQRNHVRVDVDDPIFVALTIANAHLTAVERLHQRHSKALTELMSGETARHTEAVAKNVETLSKQLSGVTVENIARVVADFGSALASFRTTLFICTGLALFSALLMLGAAWLRA